MMRWLFIIWLVILTTTLSAQQEHQYTQFTKTQLYYNPAVAGLENNLAITARHRNQWAGLEGSPTGQTIMVEFPTFYKSLGLGLSFNRNTIGIQQKTDLTGMYAYKLRVNNSHTLSLGLQLSYRQFVNDFTKEGLVAIDGFDIDPSIERKRFSKNIFNAGLGIHLDSERYYLGLAIPRTIPTNIDALNDNDLSKEARQLYGLFGLSFTLDDEWDLNPEILIKIAENSPFDLDIQNTFVYRDQLHLGMNIRTGGTQTSLFESLAMIVGFQFTPTILGSMSFDFNTTDLRQYEEGSFEILLQYRLPKNSSISNIQNPRYY